MAIKKQLTPEQKRKRGKAMIMQLIKEFAITHKMPDPFPVNDYERKKFETYKKEVIARDEELKYWDDYVRKNKWIQEYVEADQLKEIIEGKPDKKNWTNDQWHTYIMANVLKEMIEERKKEEAQEKRYKNLKHWRYYVRKNKWLHEYVDPTELKEILNR